MKRIVLFLFVAIIAVAGCQRHNVIKVVMENEEDIEEYIEECLEIWDGEVIDYKIRGHRVTLIYDSPIKEICAYAFAGWKSLKNIKIPSSVTTIGYGAFSECKSLKNIKIPSSVTTIGIFAFSGCKSLKNIKIPSSVTTIGDNAFVDCESLKKVRISRNTDLGCGVFPEDVEIIEY